MTEKELSHLVHTKADGRKLHLYSWDPISPAALPEPQDASERGQSHMRWHPLRQEWVTYSAARQNRTFKPPAEFCPLCPSKPGALQSEIPFEAFEVAVFENKFPAFKPEITGPLPDLGFLDLRQAQGKCEVIVYSGEHQGNIGTLPDERLELLLEAWIDRYNELRGQNGVQFVMPFENRGEEAGVTLHHPHGQIYAYPFVPPVLRSAVEGFRKGHSNVRFLQENGAPYTILRDEFMTAFVPPFARFPFEIWISANRPVPGPWAFSKAERRSYAKTLKSVVTLYDKFFGRTAPYLYVMHAAPVGEDDVFEFSAQFYPLLRSPNKMKFLAGCEQGAGVFLNDVLPEEAAEQLRQIL